MMRVQVGIQRCSRGRPCIPTTAVFGTDAEGAHHDKNSGWQTEVQSK